LVWALTLIVTKIGVESLPPILFTALRFFLVSVLLLPTLKQRPGKMMTIFWIAMTAGGIQFAIFFTGIKIAKDVSAVALAGQMAVPFATLLSVVVLGERIGWRRIFGIVVAVAGILTLSLDERVLTYIDGLLYGVVGAMIGAISLILMRQLNDVGVFELQGWIALFSWPVLFVLSLLIEGNSWHLAQDAQLIAWGSVVFTALFSTLVAHAGLYYLLQRYEVNLVSPLILMTPVMTAILGLVFLDDILTTQMIGGGLIALCGIALVSVRERQFLSEGR
jgi:O-acetylserine/cysteine efflux transporter